MATRNSRENLQHSRKSRYPWQTGRLRSREDRRSGNTLRLADQMVFEFRVIASVDYQPPQDAATRDPEQQLFRIVDSGRLCSKSRLHLGEVKRQGFDPQIGLLLRIG